MSRMCLHVGLMVDSKSHSFKALPNFEPFEVPLGRRTLGTRSSNSGRTHSQIRRCVRNPNDDYQTIQSDKTISPDFLHPERAFDADSSAECLASLDLPADLLKPSNSNSS